MGYGNRQTPIIITVADAENRVPIRIVNSDNTNDLNSIEIVQDTSDGFGISLSNAGNFSYQPASAQTGLLRVRMVNAADNGNAIIIWMEGVGRGLRIFVDQPTAIGAEIVDSSAADNVKVQLVNSRSDANGSFYFYRNLAAANTAGSVMKVHNDNATDDQATVEILNDAPANSLKITATDAAGGVLIAWDGDATNAVYGFTVRTNSEAFTGNGAVVFFQAQNASDTGIVLKVNHEGDPADTAVDFRKNGAGGGTVVQIVNAGTGIALFIDQNGTPGGSALRFDGCTTTSTKNPETDPEAGFLGVNLDTTNYAIPFYALS